MTDGPKPLCPECGTELYFEVTQKGWITYRIEEVYLFADGEIHVEMDYDDPDTNYGDDENPMLRCPSWKCQYERKVQHYGDHPPVEEAGKAFTSYTAMADETFED